MHDFPLYPLDLVALPQELIPLLDTGHFALATHADAVAAAIVAFHAKHAA